VDGDLLTAWGIDIGPGRSNVPHQAVFPLKVPLKNEGGWRIHFKIRQFHGGWNSDDNQTNNLGRYRLAVTTESGATADPVPANVRTILSIPVDERTDQQVQRVLLITDRNFNRPGGCHKHHVGVFGDFAPTVIDVR